MVFDSLTFDCGLLSVETVIEMRDAAEGSQKEVIDSLFEKKEEELIPLTSTSMGQYFEIVKGDKAGCIYLNTGNGYLNIHDISNSIGIPHSGGYYGKIVEVDIVKK